MNSHEPMQDNTKTSAPSCEYAGCTRAAEERCGKCGNIFCAQHVQLTVALYTCDLCIAKSKVEHEAATSRQEEVWHDSLRSATAYQQIRSAEQAKKAARKAARREIRLALLLVASALCFAGAMLLYYSRDVSTKHIVSSAYLPAGLCFWTGILLLLVRYWLRERE